MELQAGRRGDGGGRVGDGDDKEDGEAEDATTVREAGRGGGRQGRRELRDGGKGVARLAT
jgi:hypothetical protein